MGLADGSGAWWFRYLLMNPGRPPQRAKTGLPPQPAKSARSGDPGLAGDPEGCAGNPRGMPVQVWATWFPVGGKPESFIQGFALEGLEISRRGQSPFYFRVAGNEIGEGSCRGSLEVDGNAVAWNLRYRSTFRVTLSDKGWIGFSRTPHSDAVFSGEISLDGQRFAGDALAFGLQGHNCGYRHRNFWTWTHAYFPSGTTLEALVYEMPLGLVFRKAVLWHEGEKHVFRGFEETGDRETMLWSFRCAERNGLSVEGRIDGRGPSLHRLPYIKTDCSGSFEVRNNSLAFASLLIGGAGRAAERLETATGAVLEVVG